MHFALSLGYLAVLSAPAVIALPYIPSTKPPTARSLSVPVKRAEGSSLARRGNGNGPIQYSTYWYATAHVGSQQVEVMVDTGSADLWLLHPSLPSAAIAGHSTYDPSRSGKAFEGQQFKLSYGNGDNTVGGPVYRDNFQIGEASVPNMPIGIATTCTISTHDSKSGIFGLAFKKGNSIRPQQQPTFMELLQPSLSKPTFATNFKAGGGGSLIFGEVDSNLFYGPLQGPLRVDNSSNTAHPGYDGSWNTLNTRFIVGGQDVGGIDIVFDTGAPGTTGPPGAVRAYYAQIPGSQGNAEGSSWSVPCDAKLPDLVMHMKDTMISIPGHFLLAADPYAGVAGRRCNPMYSATHDSRGAVGDPFWASHVVIFNQADATISWALQR